MNGSALFAELQLSAAAPVPVPDGAPFESTSASVADAVPQPAPPAPASTSLPPVAQPPQYNGSSSVPPPAQPSLDGVPPGFEKWQGKVALVSGASSGIGWATCEALALAGKCFRFMGFRWN